MEIRRVTAEAAGWTAPLSREEEELVTPVADGSLHVFPIPPEFDLTPPVESLEIPLTGGKAIRVETGVRPILDLHETADFIDNIQAAGLKKGELDQVVSELKPLNKAVKDVAEEHYGIRGADLPEVGLTVQVNPKRTREVVDPQRFKDELGVRFPAIAKDLVHATFTDPENLRDSEGNPLTAETFRQVIEEGFSARGISPQEQDGFVVMKREIDVNNWDEVAREIRAGNLSVATLGAKTVFEVRVDALERTQGSRPSKRSSKKASKTTT